jgi:preprotein translocase subunit SecA
MFDELKATIRHDLTHTIFRVTVVRQPVPAAPARAMSERRGAVAAGGAATATATGDGSGNGAASAEQRVGPKLGRNDPCWCGSGKKFKRCHGA